MADETFTENMARAIVGTAVAEGREAELLNCLANGGSATIDMQTHELVLVSGHALESMFRMFSDD